PSPKYPQTPPKNPRDPSPKYSQSRSPKDKKPPGPPKSSGRPPRGGGEPWGGPGGSRPRRARGRGGGAGGGDGPDRKSQEWEQRRLQNIEQMNEEMEKIAEYERSRRDGVPEKNPVRNFLDDPRRCGPEPGGGPGGGPRRHGRNWGGPDFGKATAGARRGLPRAGLGAPLDPTLWMTGRQRAEYERWKRERERIDRERLERHRDPHGAWRREWDAQKPEGMWVWGKKQNFGGKIRREWDMQKPDGMWVWGKKKSEFRGKMGFGGKNSFGVLGMIFGVPELNFGEFSGLTFALCPLQVLGGPGGARGGRGPPATPPSPHPGGVPAPPPPPPPQEG
ncbi:hypothetical protein HGM15179_020244, partial [Zosterops borbonicus]